MNRPLIVPTLLSGWMKVLIRITSGLQRTAWWYHGAFEGATMKLTKSERMELQRQRSARNVRTDVARPAGRQCYDVTEHLEARLLAWTT